MAKSEITHKPALNASNLLEIFRKQFGRKYEVYQTKLIGADFVIKKSAWTGVSIKLVQKNNRTIIKYYAFAPSAAVRIFFMGLIPYLICYLTVWKEVQNEVKEFIEKAPEFK